MAITAGTISRNWLRGVRLPDPSRTALTVAIMLSLGGCVHPRATATIDSALVGRILLAEDRRDSTDRALIEGERHADARIRTLARRAFGRIRDPRFASRDSLSALSPPPVWPEPAWRLRYRALTALRNDCDALRAAF